MEFNEKPRSQDSQNLRAWAALIKSTKRGTGKFKKDYAAVATFRILDQEGKVVDETTIKGVWPSQVPDYQFSGAAQAVPCSVDFKFDYTLAATITNKKGAMCPFGGSCAKFS